MFEDFDSAIDKINFYQKRKIPFFTAIDYELDRALLLAGGEIRKVADVVKFRVGQTVSAYADSPLLDSVKIGAVSTDRAAYSKKFEKLSRAIARGDSFLANLTERTEVDLDAALEDVFFASDSPYAMCLKDAFACFSPECFVRVFNGEIFSYPMKGTIDASVPDAERRLLADEKELREHNTIVDLIRNDLSAAASEVRVRRFRFPSTVRRFGRADIIQTSSEICGRLRVPLGDALRSMLPAGSICGAPKPKTLEILRECEGARRGFYTGIFGYFDSENFDSAVAIRFVERDGGKTYFRSGGGITALSDASAEYREVIEKIYIPLRPKPRFLETIKVCGGKICSPEIHYDRYKKTLAEFYPHVRPVPVERFVEAARGAGEGVEKLRVEYGESFSAAVAPYVPKKINSLKVFDGGGIDYRFKSADRTALNALALAARNANCDDAIITKDGFVTDSSYANLVFADDGGLWTPATFLLNGTKRRSLLASGAVREREIRAADIRRFKRVIFVNAMLDISDNIGADIENVVF